MDSITTGVRGARVVMVNNATRVGLSFSWRRADEMATLIAYKARGLLAPDPEKVDSIWVRSDGENIVITPAVGGLLFQIPHAAAIEVAYAIKGHCRRMEEKERAEEVIFDHALLQRLGFNLGLTNDPKMQDAAGNEAAHNSILRKAIRSSERMRQYQIGTPGVIKEDRNGTGTKD